jgi:CBS domain-containing protein
MKLVKHLLDTKGRHIISISPDASVLDAITLMADKSIGSLLVMDSDEKLLGIVTERDYARVSTSAWN